MASRGSRFQSVMVWLGLSDDELLTAAERRRSGIVWAILGPALVVGGLWALGGAFVGGIALLVMLPFVVVGLRVVLGRSDGDDPEQRP